MKTQRIWLAIVLAFVTASVAGCHSSAPEAVSPTATVPPPPASVQQSAIQAQEYQINHSNLPPDQKQRLIQNLSGSGGK